MVNLGHGKIWLLKKGISNCLEGTTRDGSLQMGLIIWFIVNGRYN